MTTIMMLVFFSILFCLLYMGGLMTISKKRAVMFMGRLPERRRSSARFVSCSGYVKRVIRLKQRGTYCFTLRSDLSKGKLAAELLDQKKRVMMRLDDQHRRICIDADRPQRCTLIVRFQAASGDYELNWDLCGEHNKHE